MSSSSVSEIAEAINKGVIVTAEAAATAAPIVQLFNPAIGAALSTFAPVVEKFFVQQNKVLMVINQDMTNEELIEALKASKSPSWDSPLLETPT